MIAVLVERKRSRDAATSHSETAITPIQTRNYYYWYWRASEGSACEVPVVVHGPIAAY